MRYTEDIRKPNTSECLLSLVANVDTTCVLHAHNHANCTSCAQSVTQFTRRNSLQFGSYWGREHELESVMRSFMYNVHCTYMVLVFVNLLSTQISHTMYTRPKKICLRLGTNTDLLFITRYILHNTYTPFHQTFAT